MKRILTGIYFLLLLVHEGYGQVSVQFFPELHGKSIDGLFNVRILNGGAARTARLNVVVREQNKQVLRIVTPSFQLMNGLNVLPVAAVKGSNIQFSNSSSGQFINRNSFFPYGTFEYCYIIDSGEFGSWEECNTYEVLPAAPMMLSAPYDGDKLCEKRPVFQWQPSIPVIAGTVYQFVLTEVKKGQNLTEALHYNHPLVNQEGVQTPILPLPSIIPQLEEGKKYVWQVTAYKDRTILNRSEVWAFIVGCEEEKLVEKVVPALDMGYRDIEDLARGNYYVTENSLKFSVVNAYSPQNLNYNIRCVTNPSLSIKKLKEMKLENGKNKINIELKDKKFFLHDYYYLLVLQLPNGITKSLRFQYKEKL